jgi:hypothetical protein
MALTAVGVLGVIAIFLPFAWSTTPREALFDEVLWRLALPAFLPPFVLLASIRWLMPGGLSRLERIACHVLTVAALAAMALTFLEVRGPPPRLNEWISLLGPLLVLVFGAGVYLRNPRTGRGTPYSPILLLQVVYIANAILVLAGFFPDWQMGAYCVLVTTMAYAIQIDLVRKAPDRSAAS